MRKVHEPAQITSKYVNHFSLLTQFHNVPPEMLSHEGIMYLVNYLGTPFPEVQQGYIAGKLFMRAKITFCASDSLDDRMTAEHPTIGLRIIYLVYERVPQLCIYCTMVGHEISDCPKRGRALQLFSDPVYANRPEMAFVLEHHVGPWINCMNLVPRVVPEIVQQPNPAPRAVPYPNYSSPNPNTHPFMPYLNPSQVDIHSQIHDNNSVIPYSNPNKAFLLHIPPNGPTNQVARAPFEARFTVSRRKSLWAMPAASGSASLSSRARHLTINELGQPSRASPRNDSDSPLLDFHKKLRVAISKLPSGAP